MEQSRIICMEALFIIGITGAEESVEHIIIEMNDSILWTDANLMIIQQELDAAKKDLLYTKEDL